MLEKLFVEQAAPTLAGIKPGSLFSCSFSDFRQGVRLRDWNETMKTRGIEARVIGHSGNGRLLVYVYRPTRLERILSEERVSAFLREVGYADCSTVGNCINSLIRRMAQQNGFPHEIGLFLGYPLEDVQGFICHKGQNCTLCGIWKVYGDPDSARKRFAQFAHCTDVYKRLFAGGASLMRLTVAI